MLHFVSEYTYRVHNEQYAWHQITAADLGILQNQEPKRSGSEGSLSGIAALFFSGQLKEEKGKISELETGSELLQESGLNIK